MISVIRSDLYRAATIRSSWISLVIFTLLGLLLGAVNIDAWRLLTGMGAFGFAAMIVAQHHQHRTAVLLYLSQPRRLVVLSGQVVAAMVVATGFVAASGLTVLFKGDTERYGHLLTAVPVIAILAAACASIVRRSTWLLLGCAGWFVLVEGLIGKLKLPLPFTSLLGAGSGDTRGLLIAVLWAVAALVVASLTIGRDLASD
ncbi:hypothetical protein D7147_06215 [Micromonospora musae]|uniref:ABC transporter permease n=1 Tax=Micromonospora musae TaxID=1894970 RepID=A0ABX9RFP4_9ACTN|nr:hypothetical protein [Micromonospora musae]RKN22283.1 hypothetical protein D7147_06215 [Micromonospora musae]